MGWLSGILSGYADRQGEIRREAAARDEKAAATEAAVYDRLLNSENETLRNYGATGILQMGQGRKRKGGFAGWMGEMESSPIYPIIQKYMRTPQTTTTHIPAGPPETHSYTPTATMLPGQPPSGLAQPATSPTQEGPMATPQPLPTPPPTPPTVSEPPAALAANPPEAAAPPPPRIPDSLRASLEASMGSRATFTARGGMHRGATLAGPPPTPPTSVAPPEAAAPEEAEAAPPPAPPEAAVSPETAAALRFAQDQSTAPRPDAALLPQRPAGTFTWETPGTPERDETTTTLPHLPSTGEQAAQVERYKVQAEIAGLQEAFKQQGDPDWQKKGIDAYMAQHGRAGAFRPINVERTRPDGTVEQDLALLNVQTGQVFMQDGVTPLPAEYRPVIKAAGSGRALNKREEIAASLFGTGQPGEDPIALAKSLQPWQHGRVLREEGILAAEAALRRAEALQDAPLSAQARAGLTTQLASDWRAAQKPLLAMQQEIAKMNVGVNQYDQSPNAASQAVLITFQRMLDPTSVVREGEYARSQEGLGLLHRAQGMYEKLLAGGAGVPKADLIAMAETARQFLVGLKDFNDGEKARIEFRAQQSNIDTRGVFGNTIVVPPPNPGTPGAPPAPAAPVTTARPAAPPADGPGSGYKMRNGVLHKDGQPY